MAKAFTPQLFPPITTGKAREVQVVICHSQAIVFNALRQWHDLPAEPAGWRLAFAFYLHDSLIGVSTWGRPVAHHEDAETTLELTRHALAPDTPHNTATRTLGLMRRRVRQELPEIIRLISYCDMTRHHATMYKADNWTCIGTFSNKPNLWNNRVGRVEGSGRTHYTKWQRKP